MSAIEIILLVLLAIIAIRFGWPILLGLAIVLAVAVAFVVGVVLACGAFAIGGVAIVIQAIRDLAWKLGRKAA